LKTLISVTGPTASGKSSLAVDLALELGTSVISADARQVYRKMDIGTAKISKDEMKGVPHYLLDICDPDQVFSAGRFLREADRVMEELFKKQPVLVMAGGSGLYLKAVWEGLDEMPPVPERIRNEVNEEVEKYGLSRLLEELEKYDPLTFSGIDKANKRRVTRAVEFFRATGKPISQFRLMVPKKDEIFHIRIGLEVPREILYERINERVEEMFRQGLPEEVKRLSDQFGYDAPGFATVGYSELIRYFKGECSFEEAKDKIKQNTRNYAKRQMTWFRKSKDITWFSPEDRKGIFSFIHSRMKDA
jgi:tRNA dimethylallyltransferase